MPYNCDAVSWISTNVMIINIKEMSNFNKTL